jgi:predicted transcriptional regulator of viral defense system
VPLSIGVEFVWRESSKVRLANVHRTLIDMLENPQCGGGIQHTIDCLKNYFSEHYNEQLFLEYAHTVHNGVFFKRLGFLSEKLLGKNNPLALLAEKRITKGASPIDSHLSCNVFISRWNIYINQELEL